MSGSKTRTESAPLLFLVDLSVRLADFLWDPGIRAVTQQPGSAKSGCCFVTWKTGACRGLGAVRFGFAISRQTLLEYQRAASVGHE
jgi:hypothetical protein